MSAMYRLSKFDTVAITPFNQLDIIYDHLMGMDSIWVSHSKKKTLAKRVKYVNSNHLVRKRPIPKTNKKKYPTKPKNSSKIEKMNAKSDKFGLLE